MINFFINKWKLEALYASKRGNKFCGSLFWLFKKYLEMGEIAQLRKMIEHQRKVFYSVPQPTLIKEKFEEFK